MKTTNDSVALQVGGVDGTGDKGRNLSPKEAAEYLGIGIRELRGLRARRAFPYYRIGHRTVTYNSRDLAAFLDKCRVAAVNDSIKSAA